MMHHIALCYLEGLRHTDDVITIPTGKMHHIALCCLEGSTLSNLVHRRRRCARIVTYMVLLPGGQYATGQGTLHQAKDIVVAPAEPFCTAFGSYFVF